MAVEVEESLREREHMKLTLQTSPQGGLYGEESWQGQEESACKEESRQEEEVAGSLIEAIH